MNLPVVPSVNRTLRLPVGAIKVEGVPKIVAGGMPVVPLNVALAQRLDEGATLVSLDTYVRAGKLYVEFAAHLGRSLVDVSNDDFAVFKGALQGQPFRDASGEEVRLSGDRDKRTSDLMITLMYSLASQMEELYKVQFDWRRHQGISRELAESIIALGGVRSQKGLRRAHRIKWRPKKVLGLPDEQFERLLKAAYEQWGDYISKGDVAYAEDPEAQRGALFYRNSALLLIMRYGGGRRGEVPVIEFDDIDRKKSRLYLVTKGHGGPDGERLPVVLFPAVYGVIWHYVTKYRPLTEDPTEVERRRVFLSHSTRNYGRYITAQSVRKMLDALRPSLEPPWDKLLTPHTLRHSFAYDLQCLLSEAGVTTNMRHASSLSAMPYRGGVEVYADELITSATVKLEGVLRQAGLLLKDNKS